MVPVIVLPVPSTVGKGVLVSPTIYGNVVLGPTAEDRTDRADTATSEAGLAFLLDRAARSCRPCSTTRSPLRMPACAPPPRLGLPGPPRRRAALPLPGRHPVHRHHRLHGDRRARARAARGAGLAAPARADLPPPPQVPNLGEAFLRPYAQPELIAADPAYGQVVCFCERVTAGEVRDALASTIPPADLDGLRRRTRVTMGRCQGFYCTGTVTALLEQAGPR